MLKILHKDYKDKVKRLLSVMLPIIGTQIAIMGMNFFDASMSGQAGDADLAGAAIGGNIWMPVQTCFAGILLAAMPLIANLLGAGEKEKISTVVRHGMLLAVAFSVLIIVGGVIFLPPFLQGMGLAPEVYHIALWYMAGLGIGVLPFFLITPLRSLVDTLGYTKLSMKIYLLALPVNAFLNYVLIFGKLGNKDILAMQGRFHFYEGYSMKEVTFPVRVMRELGIKTLFVSNASGGTNPDFEIGDLMIITDHINYFPEHPLRGKNIPYGPRFPDMSEAYDKELIRKADAIAAEKGIKVQHGVYIGTQGPTFETPAEYKLFRILGADAVGMSTVPEVIVANHCGIKVFGVSVITDLGVEGKIVEVSHEEVQKAADAAQPKMTEIMRELINRA